MHLYFACTEQINIFYLFKQDCTRRQKLLRLRNNEWLMIREQYLCTIYTIMWLKNIHFLSISTIFCLHFGVKYANMRFYLFQSFRLYAQQTIYISQPHNPLQLLFLLDDFTHTYMRKRSTQVTMDPSAACLYQRMGIIK